MGTIWGGCPTRKLKRDADDEIEITLERDFDSREVVAPADLIAALRQTAGTLEAYRTRTPALQREVITWISAAKRPETREKRIGLAAKAVLKMAHGKKKLAR